jgi:hypothetical protein
VIIEASFFEIVFEGNSRACWPGSELGPITFSWLGKRVSCIAHARARDVSGAVNLHRADLRGESEISRASRQRIQAKKLRR